ncbi:hypothetical protein P153DRAFT_350142 [Dothidotthia symphoricarpi CBS 119687]|uniref:Uncharacterized protein n=1 Tax=Dothidotthia symphoricarpi CBS 119687 TaxID=1392245 RepID=A0A6A5ZZY2_9PLEO|nr:uncharacterized protein P153DRAFT_350142 [Dothidotthia symphoricarpi CBS 119687]KAF2124836.1 hypothetical protein P153DRAFT_350142 [Dothidotthia symphoricarpi CBS 119687]
MSFNYDRYRQDRRQSRPSGSLTYWVPLVLSLTVASAGLAAWVWSERRDDEDESEDDADLSYGEEMGRKDRDGLLRPDDSNIVSRVQGAIRRTPSPQQLFDTVSKKTAAGWAAAGAALTSIREEDRDDFGDHNRWSEEAAMRRNVEAQSEQSRAAVDTQTKSFAASLKNGPAYTGKRKTVVLVVSAESMMDLHDDDAPYRSENATILSHLPDTDFVKTNLFVLIYSPSLRSRPQSRTGTSSLGGSYSAISAPHTPGDELSSFSHPDEHTVYTPSLSARSSENLLWNTLHARALRLVENPAMVLPFSTPTGFVHMLRHISPDLVYIVDALSGANGANIEDLKRWVGQTIVVVGGDGTGLGGLVDTDDEGPVGKGKASEHALDRWWETSHMIGLGKGVEIVDASRLEDDYERRVGGRE